jgi:hypothetical protein
MLGQRRGRTVLPQARPSQHEGRHDAVLHIQPDWKRRSRRTACWTDVPRTMSGIAVHGRFSRAIRPQAGEQHARMVKANVQERILRPSHTRRRAEPARAIRSFPSTARQQGGPRLACVDDELSHRHRTQLSTAYDPARRAGACLCYDSTYTVINAPVPGGRRVGDMMWVLVTLAAGIVGAMAILSVLVVLVISWPWCRRP